MPKDDPSRHDRKAVSEAFEDGLEQDVENFGKAAKLIESRLVRGPRGEPIVRSSNIPPEFEDESMCGN